MKPNMLHYSQNQVSLDMMQKIKDVYDPKGILNPYKYLPYK
jgi:FAD/FMN-containing dehydrogenase